MSRTRNAVTQPSDVFIVIQLYEALAEVASATNVAGHFPKVERALQQFERKYGKNSGRSSN